MGSAAIVTGLAISKLPELERCQTEYGLLQMAMILFVLSFAVFLFAISRK